MVFGTKCSIMVCVLADVCVNVKITLLNREHLSQNLHLAGLGLKASAAIPFSVSSAMTSLAQVVRGTRLELCLTSSLVQDCSGLVSTWGSA